MHALSVPQQEDGSGYLPNGHQPKDWRAPTRKLAGDVTFQPGVLERVLPVPLTVALTLGFVFVGAFLSVVALGVVCVCVFTTSFPFFL